DRVSLQVRRDGVERGRVGDLPAEKPDALAAVGRDDDALLAVVHAEGERRARLVDALQAEQARAVARPVGQILGAHADIAQSLRTHGSHDVPRAIVAIILHRWHIPKNRSAASSPFSQSISADGTLSTGNLSNVLQPYARLRTVK